jgi:hypothetical protein
MRYPSTSSVAIAVLASMAFVSTGAHAANRFGVACVFNKTSIPINFQAEVGNGRWEQYRLAPGASRWFGHKYDHANQDQSPPLRVKFDSDLSKARYNIEYKLSRRAAEGETCGEGKPYGFQYEPNNHNFIDLKAL